MKTHFRTLFSYFINGLLLLAPVGLTVYVTLTLFRWLDGWITTPVPGLGLLILISGITVFGYVGSLFLFRPLWGFVEGLLQKAPLVNLVYNSLKDLVDAFVGDKKKFNKAVLVDLGNGCYKPGFITSDSVPLDSYLNERPAIMDDYWVAVYFPHSYNFSGNVFVVRRSQTKPIEAPSADFMKFIVSGGVMPIKGGHE
jgi:uncharacterized membrane protein